MRAAARIDAAYGRAPRLAALTVAGSVGEGTADRWSDLELDCYWLGAPTDADRREVIARAGGALRSWWDYDEGDGEWSEDYLLGDLPVTVSNFTVARTEAILADVVDRADVDPVAHMRLAAIQRCRPLRGAALVEEWRGRAARYPDRLVDAVVERALDPRILAGWAARDALVERGDAVALHALLAGIERSVLDTCLALNRIYRPHRVPKWQHRLLASLSVAPAQLGELLDAMWAQDRRAGLDAAARALEGTLALAERHSSADVASFREALREQRCPTGPE